MEEPLRMEGQFALRSALGELMRIGRIARRGVSYDAWASAQTFEMINESIFNPVEFRGGVNSNKATGDITHKRSQCFGEFTTPCSGNVNRLNFLKANKKVGGSKTHFKVKNLIHLQKASEKLKLYGEIAVMFTSVGWGRHGDWVALRRSGYFIHRVG